MSRRAFQQGPRVILCERGIKVLDWSTRFT
jgi:3-deoxy-D-arabino-heptulosonate 7-phosphate (DAHP) synthase